MQSNWPPLRHVHLVQSRSYESEISYGVPVRLSVHAEKKSYVNIICIKYS